VDVDADSNGVAPFDAEAWWEAFCQELNRVFGPEQGAELAERYRPRIDESYMSEVEPAQAVAQVVADEGGYPPFDAEAWWTAFCEALAGVFGAEAGPELADRYRGRFAESYMFDVEPGQAVAQVHLIELVRAGDPVAISVDLKAADDGYTWGRVISRKEIKVGRLVHVLENLGAAVADQRPHKVLGRRSAGVPDVWVYNFRLDVGGELSRRRRKLFEEAFLAVWRGDEEDDSLNTLVLRAGLSARRVRVLRAIGRYVRQGGITYQDDVVEKALLENPRIASLLVSLFERRFNPDRQNPAMVARLEGQLVTLIKEVENLAQDNILQWFLTVVRAMTRTNYFCKGKDGAPLPWLSFKLMPDRIPQLPDPRPRYEIWVYSPMFEGVHMRYGLIARGGIRLSIRLSDFRREVMELVHTQNAKNGLIVPAGAKGAFVVKLRVAGRKEQADLAETCYRMFLSALLDVTDNIVEDEVVAPPRVVRLDSLFRPDGQNDDPYLVVAADKGTATYSDVANEVSKQYGFWLGDAFASGGSNGYDHKKMGITARGAWEAVRYHCLRRLGIDVDQQDFTVVGIGDMSGDVFGNGMLLSEHIRLVAAFDHRHIFLDPNPDAAVSFAERRRLFAKLRSSWGDYNPDLISTGGGVFPRDSKSIQLSAEVKQALGIHDVDELTPNALIQRILTAQVDLLFNGGIGTYIKASTERHADVGDKANDLLRVDANQVRARVVAEGGNLGCTQAGRVEYALVGGPDGKGGLINTDAIDNVAGVNCSDHEVNIKILLDWLVGTGAITVAERNELLAEMEGAVAERVLYATRRQIEGMADTYAQSTDLVDVHARLIRTLEQRAGLDRNAEHLPSDLALGERKADGRGLVVPELAIVIAFAKNWLRAELLRAEIADAAFLATELARYFPRALLDERFRVAMLSHRLSREILATELANEIVDRLGPSFALRMLAETGATAAQLVRAYLIAREVFDLRTYWAEVEALGRSIDEPTRVRLLIESERLLERACRWLIGANPSEVSATVQRFLPAATLLAESLGDLLPAADWGALVREARELDDANVPGPLASRAASMRWLAVAFDVDDAVGPAARAELEAGGLRIAHVRVAVVLFGLTALLGLDWLRARITKLPRASARQDRSRSTLRGKLDGAHRVLLAEVLAGRASDIDGQKTLAGWRDQEHIGLALGRYRTAIAEIRSGEPFDADAAIVALNELEMLSAGHR
jgi:glutamate dehydrogenase